MAPSGPDDLAGSVALDLQVAFGLALSTVDWEVDQLLRITPKIGRRNVVETGTVDVSHSQAVQFVVGGLAPTTNYEIVLTATTDDGVPCASPLVPFTIVAGQTTSATVNLVCTPPPPPTFVDSGSLVVNGTVTLAEAGPPCPAITSLSALPSRADVGGTIALSATGAGLSDADIVGVSWSVSGGDGSGSLSTTTSPSPTFTCLSPGTVIVRVIPSDATSLDCDPTKDSASVTLTCDALSSDGGTAAGP